MVDLHETTQEDDFDFFKIDEGLLANKRKRENSIHFIEDQIKANILEENKRKNEAKSYEFGYKIFLNNFNEEGFIEDFLGLEVGNVDDKNVKEGNELFNFGLNHEKWVRLLNKSILMHYERHLVEKAIQVKSKSSMLTPLGSFNMNMINPLNRGLTRFPVPNFPGNNTINTNACTTGMINYGMNMNLSQIQNMTNNSNINQPQNTNINAMSYNGINNHPSIYNPNLRNISTNNGGSNLNNGSVPIQQVSQNTTISNVGNNTNMANDSKNESKLEEVNNNLPLNEK